MRRPVKHVQRAQIVLLSADRLPVLEIAKRVGISRPMVWRWQQRYAEEGLDGLLRDKTRPPGTPPVPQAKVHAVVERTLREPPGRRHALDRPRHGQGHEPVAAHRPAHLGRRTSCSRTGSGPSSARPIPSSPPSSTMSSAST